MKFFLITLSLFNIILTHASDPMSAKVGTYEIPANIKTNKDLIDHCSKESCFPRIYIDITHNGESLAYTDDLIDTNKNYTIKIYNDYKHIGVHQSSDDLYRVSTSLSIADQVIKKAFALDTSLSRQDRIYLEDSEKRDARYRAEIKRQRAEEVDLEIMLFTAKNKK